MQTLIKCMVGIILLLFSASCSTSTGFSTFPSPIPTSLPTVSPTSTSGPTLTPSTTPLPPHPLMVEVMRQQEYPGSDLVFEKTLSPALNYDRFIVSYLSEGLKIYAYMTIPRGERPASGWPVIIFNHGFIPPTIYKTTERYIAYQNTFASHEYIVFRSDYRGHDQSEGLAESAYGSPAYTVDVLNGMASVMRYADADPDRVGMWGHSMGGYITLRSMVISRDIKAGVIWGGVVGSYPELFEHWWKPRDSTATPDPDSTRGRWRIEAIERYGSPEENPEFWAAVSANSYLVDISGPLQLHHSIDDESVPVILSQLLYSRMLSMGLNVELYTYDNDDHDITNHFNSAMRESVRFFDAYVKGE